MCTNSEILPGSFPKIKRTAIENINNMIVGNNCINSFPDGCDDLKISVTKMINILIITKTKIDATFPVSYFHIDGFSEPYPLGKSRNWSIEKILPVKFFWKRVLPTDTEAFFIGLSFKKINGY